MKTGTHKDATNNSSLGSDGVVLNSSSSYLDHRLPNSQSSSTPPYNEWSSQGTYNADNDENSYRSLEGSFTVEVRQQRMLQALDIVW